MIFENFYFTVLQNTSLCVSEALNANDLFKRFISHTVLQDYQ